MGTTTRRRQATPEPQIKGETKEPRKRMKRKRKQDKKKGSRSSSQRRSQLAPRAEAGERERGSTYSIVSVSLGWTYAEVVGKILIDVNPEANNTNVLRSRPTKEDDVLL